MKGAAGQAEVDPVTVPAERRRITRLRLAVGLFMLATALGTLLFIDRYLSRIADGRSGEWPRVLIEELSGTYAAALLVPLMVLLARRFPPFGPGWSVNLPLHLPLACLVGALHTTLSNLSCSVFISMPGLGPDDYGLSLQGYLISLPNQLIVYTLVLAITHNLDRYRRARNRELEAVQLRAALTQAQLEALRRQLEPHFLFTTLNSVSELIYSRPAAAEEMIARLSALLRHAFSPASDHETTLADELRLLDLYLDIMRLRFAERLFVQIDVPDALRPARVPRLLLQPLIDDALRQSADPSHSLVAVKLIARQEADELVLRVCDRGQPRTADAAHGIGVQNAAQRVVQLYGRRFGISRVQGQEEGSELQVRLPLRLGPLPASGAAGSSRLPV